jgi:hypothetical protein
MTPYLQGMTRQMAAKYLTPRGTKPKAARVNLHDIPRYPIKVSVGCRKGKESFVTVKMSLNQLREAGRRILTGNGGYLETVERVRQFKDGSLLSNE